MISTKKREQNDSNIRKIHHSFPIQNSLMYVKLMLATIILSL